MESNIFKVKNLLFLVFLIKVGYSETEITTMASIKTVSSNLDGFLQQNAWEVLKNTITDLNHMKILYLNVSEAYNKRTESMPKPIEDVVKTVNSFEVIVSIRATLNSIFPAFWKISLRRQCLKLLDEQIQAYDKEFDNQLESTYHAYMKEIQQNLLNAYIRINSMINSLKLNYSIFLKNCTNDNRNCEMVPYINILNNNLQNIKLDIEFMDKDFKNLSQAWVRDYVYGRLIPSIKGCLE